MKFTIYCKYQQQSPVCFHAYIPSIVPEHLSHTHDMVKIAPVCGLDVQLPQRISHVSIVINKNEVLSTPVD